MLKLLAFVLPLGLDSFAVAAAIGAVQQATARQRLRISLVFVIFEGGMPLIGLGLGSALARGIGHVADYLAAAAVIGIGAWMLLAGDKDEEDKASRLTSSHGLALVPATSGCLRPARTSRQDHQFCPVSLAGLGRSAIELPAQDVGRRNDHCRPLMHFGRYHYPPADAADSRGSVR